MHADPPVVHWSASARAVGERYLNLTEWVDLYLKDKWAALLAARRLS